MSIVVSNTTYASDTWKSPTKSIQQLEVFQQRCLRNIMNIKWQDRVTNKEVLPLAGMLPLSKLMADRKVQLMGHTVRLPSKRPARKALEWIPDGRRRPRGRPKKTWRSTVTEDLQERGTNWFQALRNAGNHRNWRPIAALRLEDPGNQVTYYLILQTHTNTHTHTHTHKQTHTHTKIYIND